MAAPPTVLGIDAGGSSTRWSLRRVDPRHRAGGEEIGRGQAGPLSGLAFLGDGADRDAASAVVAELAAAVAATPGDAPPAFVHAGVTGLSDGDPASEALRDLLARHLRTPATAIRVVNDMALAYRCAFAPGEGVLVYAGTGSLAVHVASDGALLRVGGHGYLIDDAGGGFWIGRHALRWVLREADRTGAPARGPLASAVYAALGGDDWSHVRARVYGGGRAEVAALVPAVRHALAAGDPAAAGIVAAAGRELARLADVALARLGRTMPVALAGGASGLGAPLRRALVAALPPGTEVRVADRAPVETAAALAAEAAAKAGRAGPS